MMPAGRRADATTPMRGLGLRVAVAATAAGAVLGAALAVAGGAQAQQPGARARTATALDTASLQQGCGSDATSFRPVSVRIPGVVGPTRVLALGLDRHGVPRTPPLTPWGKWRFAWDKTSGIEPGNVYGVVRLNAHTYPQFAGLALGNRLLARLGVGGVIVVSGSGGQVLCYEVTGRVSVPSKRSLRAYYGSSGRPRLAILVCSGRRLGPENWSRRTIWWADPRPAPDTQAAPTIPALPGGDTQS